AEQGNMWHGGCAPSLARVVDAPGAPPNTTNARGSVAHRSPAHARITAPAVDSGVQKSRAVRQCQHLADSMATLQENAAWSAIYRSALNPHCTVTVTFIFG